jgi:sugar phosphate permease
MRIKIFYGWYIVLTGLVLAAYNAAIFSYGWTGFVNPLVATFGWSMAQLSIASSLRTLEIGVFNPVWGTAVDRFSPRKLVLIGLISTALGIFCLSRTENLVMYYGGFVIVGLGSSLISNILPIAVISRWFKRDLGKANGLFYMGAGLGGVAVPLVVRIIDMYGWQTTLFFGAIGLLVIGLPLSFVYRSRPQDYGLLPDGKPLARGEERKRRPTVEFGSSIKEVLKTRAFWHIGVVNLCHALSMSALNLYAIPYLTNAGISRVTAGTVVSLFTLVSLFARFPMGAFSDYFKKKHVIAVSIILQMVGIFVFWLVGAVHPFWLILLFGITWGLGLGGAGPLRAPILTEYFGTKNFGAVFGISSLFLTIGQTLSPPLAGWVYDTYHDYRIWWVIAIGLNIWALTMILTIPAAKKRTEPVYEAAPAVD